MRDWFGGLLFQEVRLRLGGGGREGCSSVFNRDMIDSSILRLSHIQGRGIMASLSYSGLGDSMTGR